jgi:pimeloyl-ACP methyl ester carboxylesterase
LFNAALLVFAEHRYFGESLPFGDASFDVENRPFLSAEQALADYAVLIREVKTILFAENCPVISFGGSYGGMLTTWFRKLYPDTVIGGLAGSAPFGFPGTGICR